MKEGKEFCLFGRFSSFAIETAEYVQTHMSAFHKKVGCIVSPLVDYPQIMPDMRFNCYPIIFLDAFPTVDLTKVKQLSLAFRLGWQFVTISDDVFDTFEGATPSNVICAQQFYDSYLRELHKIFPPESVFWSHYDLHLQQYSKAALAEIIKIRFGLKSFSFEEFKKASANISSFGKIAIAGLAILNETPSKIARLARSHDNFYIAAQFMDDLVDWKEDHSKKRYTFLIRYALSQCGICLDDFIRKWPTTEELEKMIFSSGVAKWAIAKSRKYFVKAREDAVISGVPSWINIINIFLNSLDNLSDIQSVGRE